MLGFPKLATGMALGLGALSGGCSLAFSTPPASGAERERARPEFDCTTSNLAPIVDSVLSSYELLRSGYALSADAKAYRDYPIGREADLALGLGFAALFAGSAIYGYSAAARCSRVKRGAPAGDDPKVIGVSLESVGLPLRTPAVSGYLACRGQAARSGCFQSVE